MGKEFLEIFEQWAGTYDDTVTGHDIEYREVFKHYDRLLQMVADRAYGHVVEFGPGTGNLTTKFIEKGLKVTGIEPSPSMRALAIEKVGKQSSIIDGDFLSFSVDQPIDIFASSYAFHHLTDEEKGTAIAKYGKLLATGGKIVFADTMYESADAYKQAIKKAVEDGFHNLAEDLQREYYTTIPFLKGLLEENGFTAAFEQCNDFVWIMEGVKK
ncbi:putative AdoMet-dependent methyltransferase [Cytobacillus eiseniae]|uniref:Uncharacterized methyltransferase J2Z40_001067 n=1 Tax=Cytobacillus eiseniae TaxID=762947 RepID=A0ABS4RDT4_9BACI|nr:class I SAM-dependent methyltransferase [Cytobacillus eiseniae]MBP2240510.1 putative AdoMet-dependent methyltransferase [Cytobacillus eiseniae]